MNQSFTYIYHKLTEHTNTQDRLRATRQLYNRPQGALDVLSEADEDQDHSLLKWHDNPDVVAEIIGIVRELDLRGYFHTRCHIVCDFFAALGFNVAVVQNQRGHDEWQISPPTAQPPSAPTPPPSLPPQPTAKTRNKDLLNKVQLLLDQTLTKLLSRKSLLLHPLETWKVYNLSKAIKNISDLVK